MSIAASASLLSKNCWSGKEQERYSGHSIFEVTGKVFKQPKKLTNNFLLVSNKQFFHR